MVDSGGKEKKEGSQGDGLEHFIGTGYGGGSSRLTLQEGLGSGYEEERTASIWAEWKHVSPKGMPKQIMGRSRD